MYLSAKALVEYGVYHGLIHKDFTYVGFMEKEVDYSKNLKRNVPPFMVTRSRDEWFIDKNFSIFLQVVYVQYM